MIIYNYLKTQNRITIDIDTKSLFYHLRLYFLIFIIFPHNIFFCPELNIFYKKE